MGDMAYFGRGSSTSTAAAISSPPPGPQQQHKPHLGVSEQKAMLLRSLHFHVDTALTRLFSFFSFLSHLHNVLLVPVLPLVMLSPHKSFRSSSTAAERGTAARESGPAKLGCCSAAAAAAGSARAEVPGTTATRETSPPGLQQHIFRTERGRAAVVLLFLCCCCCCTGMLSSSRCCVFAAISRVAQTAAPVTAAASATGVLPLARTTATTSTRAAATGGGSAAATATGTVSPAAPAAAAAPTTATLTTGATRAATSSSCRALFSTTEKVLLTGAATSLSSGATQAEDHPTDVSSLFLSSPSAVVTPLSSPPTCCHSKGIPSSSSHLYCPAHQRGFFPAAPLLPLPLRFSLATALAVHTKAATGTTTANTFPLVTASERPFIFTPESSATPPPSFTGVQTPGVATAAPNKRFLTTATISSSVPPTAIRKSLVPFSSTSCLPRATRKHRSQTHRISTPPSTTPRSSNSNTAIAAGAAPPVPLSSPPYSPVALSTGSNGKLPQIPAPSSMLPPIPLGLTSHSSPFSIHSKLGTGITAPFSHPLAALLRVEREEAGVIKNSQGRAIATTAAKPAAALPPASANSLPAAFRTSPLSLSSLLSTLLPKNLATPSQDTQREVEKSSVAFFTFSRSFVSSGAAVARRSFRHDNLGAGGISSSLACPPSFTTRSSSFSPPQEAAETVGRLSRSPTGAAVASTAAASSPSASFPSRIGAAARSAFSLPLCAGCSSLVPSFIMAAASSTTGSAVSTAVETPERQQQAQQQHVILRPKKHPVEKVRLDYKPPDFLIDFVDLVFDLHEEKTKVTSKLTLRRRPGTEPADLVLDGEELTLLRVQLGEQELTDATGERGSKPPRGAAAGEKQEQQHKRQLVDSHRVFALDVDGRLVIGKDLLPPEADKQFQLTTEVYIHPSANLQLLGLYKSGRLLVTQCEAEGFRRITYFIDRPDIMSLYKVKLIADKQTNPTLLSNGNKLEEGDVEGQPGKHFAVFEDPFRKPCYLFALVAGDLAYISDKFVTASGREVLVRIFSEPQDRDKLTWALQSLLKAMQWDEKRFGLEYDLDIFNVVCAKDFNMGAMENKSLNIFNAALLLAHPKISTDLNYQRIANVIGHEYFHNWTGNRVTCRDWFQLTLKEGLTVFRDQQFTADMFSAAVKRIEDVAYLRQVQFVEDSGPMAHPIRPETYVAIDNFYTSTVYSKGAEVIRMYHTLLGERGFREGMNLYFKRHDGQAVTCDDFRKAMADANNKNLDQFELWYLQAGTPELEVLEARYLGDKEHAFVLTVKQTTAPTPKQPEKKPFHIPIKFGLIGKQSKKDLLQPPTQVLELTSTEQTFVISGVKEDCVLSFLRDFSAPVRVKNPLQTDEDLAFLMGYDSDDFSKWQAAHTLVSKIVAERAVQKRDHPNAQFSPLPEIYVNAFRETLLEQKADKSVQAYTLRLPGLDDLAEQMEPIDPEALYIAAQSVRREIGKLLCKELMQVYEELTPPETETVETRDQKAIARRRLRNEALYFLTGENDAAAAKLAMKHFTSAKGMTDRFAALAVLVDTQQPEKKEALDIFYEEAEGDPIVLDKWFALQAMSECPDTTDVVGQLQKHPDFTMRNPNRLRALMFTFSRGTQFHNTDGRGYRLLADCVVEVDKFNHQVAAHGAGAFLQWRKYDEKRQKLMVEQLQRIRSTPGLSPDTMEIVQKALADDPALVRRRSPTKSEESEAALKEKEKTIADK